MSASWGSVFRVTSMCCDARLQPPRHGHAQAPHHTSWDGCPVMLQCLLQLSDVLWRIRLVLNTTSQLVPHVLYWVHIRGNCWPVQHSDMVGTKKRLCIPGIVRPSVVLLEDEPVSAMPSHQWKEDRPQDVVDVVLRIKVSLYHHEFGPEASIDGAPNHDSAAPVAVPLQNTGLRDTFSTTAVNAMTSVRDTHVKSRFIREDDISPSPGSQMPTIPGP
jgi:hypothetical protein